MLMLESMKVRNKLNTEYRRYSLAEMISESYRVLYSCKRGTRLYNLVEAHIRDVRENPTELDKLSENLHLLKQASKLGPRIRINEDELAQTKPDQELTDESETEDVEKMEGPDVIDEADGRFKSKKSILPTVEEIELKEKACKESIRKTLGKKFVKESTSRSYKNCKSGLKNFCESSRSKAFYKTFKKMSESLKDPKKPLTLAESISLYKAANSAMTQLAIELEHNPQFIKTFSECTALLCRDTRNLLTCIKAKRAPHSSILESLSSFSNVLLEEDEYNWDEEEVVTKETPGVTAEEIPAIIDAEIPEETAEEIAQEIESAETPAEVVEDAISDISDEEAEDLLKYLYVMRQSEEGTEEYQDVEMPDDFEAGDITDDELAELASHLKEARRIKKFREARRLKRVKEALRPFGKNDYRDYGGQHLPNGEDPLLGNSKDGIVDVVVSGDVGTPDIYVSVIISENGTDIKEYQKDFTDIDTAKRVANGILNSYDKGRDLGSLLDAYKFTKLFESRRIKRVKEDRAHRKQMKEALRPFKGLDYNYEVPNLPSGDVPMIGTSDDENVDVVVSGDEAEVDKVAVSVVYDLNTGDEPGEALKLVGDQDTATRLANSILNAYNSGKDLKQLLRSYKFQFLY